VFRSESPRLDRSAGPLAPRVLTTVGVEVEQRGTPPKIELVVTIGRHEACVCAPGVTALDVTEGDLPVERQAELARVVPV
jgi:hypothetical protein